MKRKFKNTDIVYCPVCEGTGFMDRTSDETGISATSCPHGDSITYKEFKEIKLPGEKPKLFKAG
jgi:hypothetical protein